ncbi:MAG: carbohydrate kinase family protein [Candidatus Kerfeldbacteria bacterium]|nr:carbohydrate kinase family protein [Candidatus Kerfeldbacteria bacterium]
MIRSLDLITIGGATRDIMFLTAEGTVMPNPGDPMRQTLVGFEYGAKIMSRVCHFMVGGGACNVAVGARRLGLKTAAIVSLGTDRDGDALLQDLRTEGVRIDGVKRHATLRTGFSFIVVTERSGEHVAFLYRGANDALVVSRRDLQRRRTRWVYVSSVGKAAWERIQPTLLDVVSERPVKFAWNPGENQLMLGFKKIRPVLERTDVLLVNKDEATELVVSSGIRLTGALRRIPVLLKALQGFGPQLVVITDGARGAAVFNGHQLYSAPAVRGKVVDTTGAGDAFGAGFLAGLRLFHDLQPALQLGLRNAAAECATIGTQTGLLRWSQVAKIFERHRK